MLVIEDYELFDFIDDYLGDDCDMPYESRQSRERPGGEIVTLYFSMAIDVSSVENALLMLPPEKIEEVYRLNNKAQ